MPRTMGTHDDEAGSSRSKRFRQHETVEEVLLPQVYHEFLIWEGCNRDAKSRCRLTQLLPRHIYSPCIVNWDVLNRMGYDGEIDDILRIRLREARLDEEIFTSVAWIRAFNINEPIYAKLCHEFYLTYEFDKVCADDEFQTKKIIKFRLGGRAHSLTLLEFAQRLGLYQAVKLEEEGFNVYFEGGLRSDEHFNAQDYWLSISREEYLGLSRNHTSTIRNPILRVIHKMITYGLCQRTTEYDKVQKNDLWLLSMFDARHQNRYANVSWVIARWMKRKGAGTQKESQICCGQFISNIARKSRVLTKDVVKSLSAPIYCRDLDTIILRDLIDSGGKLILEDPQPGIPRNGCYGVIDDMLRIRFCEVGSDEEIFTSVAWIRAFNINEPIYVEICHDLTLLEFARMLGLYQAVELEEEGFIVYFEGAYNPPGYAQPHYDQYYQQYPPPPPQYQQQQQDDDEYYSQVINDCNDCATFHSPNFEAGIFKGIKIDSTLNLSHLFYADDVVFIGEWSPSNLSGITNILHCFSLLSGLSINLKKSNLLGVRVRSEYVKDAAVNLGCLTMKTPFKYLGVMVVGICATSQAWEDTIGKLKARLSNWKLKTLPSSSPFRYSTWLSIIREIHSLKDRGVIWYLIVAYMWVNGFGRTNFWKEVWIGDNPLCVLFPRIFALETNKDSSVAVKLSSVTSSLRRPVRGGSESS
ncbi:hypothetical protein Tco_0025419 [Tanacetum coccineum]